MGALNAPPPLKKIFRQPIPENSRLFPPFYWWCHYEKKFQNVAFLLAEIILRYHLIFGPPGTPYKQNEEKSKSHIWSVGYQNEVRRVRGGHFWRNFWKIFKNKDVDLKIWHNQYKIIFFALIKKTFLNPSWNYFRYH